MIKYLLPMRFLILIACLAALLGAILMFCLAGVKLLHGAEILWTSGFEPSGEVAAAVMGATDAFLFAVVLITFAYVIAFGLVFRLSTEARERIPELMRIESISELKHILVEVIIVYLAVDFATDLAIGDDLVWQTLIKPLSITLIAAALHLMGAPPAGHR